LHGCRVGNPERIAIIQPSVDAQRLRWVNIATKFINPERVVSSTNLGHYFVMPQSLAKILVHTVFSTKDRRPFLRDKPLREELHRYLGGILTNHDCQPIIIGGVEDHVHILSTLSRTGTAAEMVKEIKRGSSLWLKTKSPDLHGFACRRARDRGSRQSRENEKARAHAVSLRKNIKPRSVRWPGHLVSGAAADYFPSLAFTSALGSRKTNTTPASVTPALSQIRLFMFLFRTCS
jgi:REP element-mobilizing transposase RayT